MSTLQELLNQGLKVSQNLYASERTTDNIAHAARSIISSTAAERYLDFLKRSPYFFNRISNVQITSYLGITPEFLSTIRKKITKS